MLQLLWGGGGSFAVTAGADAIEGLLSGLPQIWGG